MVLDCFPFLGDCMFDFPPLFFSVSYNIRPQIDVKKADDNFSQLIMDVIILGFSPNKNSTGGITIVLYKGVTCLKVNKDK